jgi:probable HAF family extracellular repeat protein
MRLPYLTVRQALIAALALTFTLRGTAAVEYTPVVLDSPSHAIAFGLNNQGQVVGRAAVQSGETHAVLWQDGRLVDLGTIPGGQYSEAYAINDRGQVVGWSTIDQSTCTAFDGCWHAFHWEDGIMTDLLGLDPRFQSYAYSLNDKGQIVGISATQDYPFGDFRPVLWHNGSIVDLGKPEGATNAYTNGVNAMGDAAGSATFADGSTVPLVWSRGSRTELPRPPGTTFTEARKINNRGQIVGTDGTNTVLWTDGRLTVLPNPPGAGSSNPSDINASGVVVGRSSQFAGRRAVIWENGQPATLPMLPGWTDSEAYGVNDRGDVVGHASTSIGLRAVMWVRN